jgi:hypothetical protein
VSDAFRHVFDEELVVAHQRLVKKALLSVAFCLTDTALEAFPAREQYSHVRTVNMFAKAGVDVDALAATLQENAAKSFVDAWRTPWPTSTSSAPPSAP